MGNRSYRQKWEIKIFAKNQTSKFSSKMGNQNFRQKSVIKIFVKNGKSKFWPKIGNQNFGQKSEIKIFVINRKWKFSSKIQKSKFSSKIANQNRKKKLQFVKLTLQHRSLPLGQLKQGQRWSQKLTIPTWRESIFWKFHLLTALHSPKSFSRFCEIFRSGIVHKWWVLQIASV